MNGEIKCPFFAYLRIEVAKIKPREMLSRQNRKKKKVLAKYSTNKVPG